MTVLIVSLYHHHHHHHHLVRGLRDGVGVVRPAGPGGWSPRRHRQVTADGRCVSSDAPSLRVEPGCYCLCFDPARMLFWSLLKTLFLARFERILDTPRVAYVACGEEFTVLVTRSR
jgi:hypothetical protein